MNLIKLYVGFYGEFFGISLVTIVSLWDFTVKGARGFFEYAIGVQGIVAIWIGLLLIVGSKHFKNEINQGKQ